MSLSSDLALHKVTQLITHAEELLHEAETVFYREIEGKIANSEFREAIRLEEVLHGATHETASSLGLYLQEIKMLLPRFEIRQMYMQLTNSEFLEIVSQEWSLSLVQKTHEKLQSRSRCKLAETSDLIKAIQRQWASLPR